MEPVTTLATALSAIRDRIEAQTSLRRSRTVDSLRTLPDHLQPLSFAAWPGSSRNTQTQRASSSQAMITDEIVIEYAGRLTVDEIGSLDTLLAKVRGARNAITTASWWRASGLQCVEWVADRRQRVDGWVIVSSTFRVSRQDALG